MIDRMVEEWCRVSIEPSYLHWNSDLRLCARFIHYFYTGQLMGAF